MIPRPLAAGGNASAAQRPSPVLARVHRDPVVAFDGKVVGYTLTLTLDLTPVVPTQGGARGAEIRTPIAADAPRYQDAPARLGEMLHEQYLALDLPNLVADRYAFLPATPAMLAGFLPAAPSTGRLVLDLPVGFELEDDAVRRCAALRAQGVELSLSGYRGGANQIALLPQLAFVTLDPALLAAPGETVPGPALADVVRSAHAVGTQVLADAVDALTAACSRTAGVDAVRGGETQPAQDGAPRVLRAGQLQCLAVMHLLNEPEREVGKIAEVIDTDPVLTLRVLHLVNSGVFALRREVDTVHHAVVLLGPRELTPLVAALALDARADAMDSLWLILARALTVEALTDDPTGYTVGMLSGLIDQLGVPADVVLEKVGVSAGVAHAVRDRTGPLGEALAAVLAHERQDYVTVLSLGLAPLHVSDTYISCLADALATARAVSPA